MLFGSDVGFEWITLVRVNQKMAGGGCWVESHPTPPPPPHPTEPHPMLTMLLRVRVPCRSAGIGRTGTLIAIYMLLLRLRALMRQPEPPAEQEVRSALDVPESKWRGGAGQRSRGMQSDLMSSGWPQIIGSNRWHRCSTCWPCASHHTTSCI